MKNNLILILVLIAVLAIAAVVFLKPVERTVVSEEPIPVEPDGGIGSDAPIVEGPSQYVDPTLGMQFSFDDGKDGYVLDERTSTEPGMPQKAVTLIPRDIAAEYEGDNIPSEGPISISVLVFPNTAKEWPSVWADKNIAYSNINLAFGEPQETVVGGTNAIRYTADGLYANDTVVVAHGSYMYVISASYIDENSQTRVDFEPFLNSFTFIPEVEA